MLSTSRDMIILIREKKDRSGGLEEGGRSEAACRDGVDTCSRAGFNQDTVSCY